jgi:hypothetical protein
MASLNDIMAKKGCRLCKVGGEFGYFHCWEQYGDVIFPGLTVGSNPGGQYSRVFGIVEFYDQIQRIDPTKIQFVDATHDFLRAYSKTNDRKENTDV